MLATFSRICRRFTGGHRNARPADVERLEHRRLLSGGAHDSRPKDPPAPSAVVYKPHAKVEGRTLGEWSAQWWKKIFSIPVYARDGKTIIHPQFDAPLNPGETVKTNYAFPSQDGEVTFLAGSFFGGPLNRTVNVPADKPIFVPLINTEWSNLDTAAKPNFNTYPGNYTAKELLAYADTQARAVDQLDATLDGKPIKNLFDHRERAGVFTYKLPEKFNIIQTFFGLPISGKVHPAVADGYYLMLKPLSPGKHVLKFTGHTPDLSATPPLLGEFNADMTYTINVQPRGRHHWDGGLQSCKQNNAGPSRKHDAADEVFDRADSRVTV